MTRIFEKIEEAEGPDNMFQAWRQERAYRIGRLLTIVGITLGLIATLVDLHFRDLMAVYADLVFLMGALISLALSRREKGGAPYFFWWPAYLGLWISSLPTLFSSGGIHSPFLGLYLVLFFLAALIIQTELKPAYVCAFVILNLLGWSWLEYHEITTGSQEVVPAYLVATLALLGTSVVACVLVFVRAESELAREVVKGHESLDLVRANLAREEAANSAKSAFLANISHELRTPLGAILGYAELALESEPKTENKTEYIETIYRNAKQLAHLVDDLLDISKVEANKIEIEESAFLARDFFKEIVELMRLSAEKKGLVLSLEIGHSIPRWIHADQLRLKQILINIIGNAIKFTERGRVTVKAAYESDPSSEQGGRIRIDIVDTGRGLGAEERVRLFKPFSQADSRVSRQYGGTGLGLYLARKLAILMGGDLRLISSERGLGSVFSFVCPVREPSESELAQLSNADDGLREKAGRLDGVRILVVDDTFDSQRLVCTYLRAAGAEADCANDGFEAINAALTGKFDVVVMDVQMPVLDGQGATRMLRQKGFDRPIIALTAHAMAEDRERCWAAGFTAYLAKPVDRRVLIQTIAEVSSKNAASKLVAESPSIWR